MHALSFLLGSSPRRWSHTLAAGRWRCRNTLACLGDARSRCWWSPMCLPVCGWGPTMPYIKPVVWVYYVLSSALHSPFWLKVLFLISKVLLHALCFTSSKPVSVVELFIALSARTWSDNNKQPRLTNDQPSSHFTATKAMEQHPEHVHLLLPLISWKTDCSSIWVAIIAVRHNKL